MLIEYFGMECKVIKKYFLYLSIYIKILQVGNSYDSVGIELSSQ
jgi:hypothetical protein